MKRLVIVVTILCYLISIIGFSDTNIDIGTGDGTKLGTKDNYWLEGWYGVRASLVMKTKGGWRDISVVDIASPSAPVGRVAIHFGQHSKVEYVGSGRELEIFDDPSKDPYKSQNTELTIPVLFNASGVGSKDEIKGYFSDAKVSDSIANILTEGRTINGKALDEYFNANSERFRIVIEPILYCMYRGMVIAGTPTQWAFFHNFLNKGKENANSHLRERLYIVTHLNAPLSMYLERSELGIDAPAAGETTTTLTSNWGNSGLPDWLIFKKLGVGMMSKTPFGTKDKIEIEFDYLCDRYVITSIFIKDYGTKGYDLKNPAWVEFTVGGQTYRHDNIYLPPGGSGLAWFKWKTPKTPGTVKISVKGNVFDPTTNVVINAKIARLTATLPPDPEAEDRNDTFNYGIKPPSTQAAGTESNSWTVYDCKWQAKLVLEEVDNPNYNVSVPKGDPKYDDRKKIKDWVDKGSYLFTPVTYTATLKGSLEITPDDRVPTRDGKRMGSGYGFNAVVDARVATSAPSSDVTKPQTSVVYFPEFHYKTYTRIMEMVKGKLQLPVNIFSHFDRRVLFTPVWFKDGDYVVYAEVSDAWTPAGQLKYSYTDKLEIKGSVYDDWRVVPIRER